MMGLLDFDWAGIAINSCRSALVNRSDRPSVRHGWGVIFLAIVLLAGASGFTREALADEIIDDGVSVDSGASLEGAAYGGLENPAGISGPAFPWSASVQATADLTLITATASATGGRPTGLDVIVRGAAPFLLDQMVFTNLAGFEALPDAFTAGFDREIDFIETTTRVQGGIDNPARAAATSSMTIPGTRRATRAAGPAVDIGPELNSDVTDLEAWLHGQ